MKMTTSKQANCRFHLGLQGITSGKYSTPRILAMILLFGFLSAAPTVWSQTRDAAPSTSRSASRSSDATNVRTEKKATEARSERKTVETRSGRTRSESTEKEVEKRDEPTRKPEVNRDARRQESTRSQEAVERRETPSRRGDSRDAASQRRPEDPLNIPRGERSDGPRVVTSTRLSSGYRIAPGIRTPDRNKIQLPDIRFRHDRERCTFCLGVGFIYAHDMLHRLRCSHCYGRGFAIEFIPRLDDVCPICYGPVLGYGSLHRRSIQNTANYVMDRLDLLLDLSRSQKRAIKSIVLDYLRESRYDGWYDPVVVRDRAIMNELSYRQREIYADFINNVDSRDLCDRCFDYF